MNSKLKSLKNWMLLLRSITYFKGLIKTVKRRQKLSNNDRLRFVIQNEELPNTISTKFNNVQDFKLGDLEQVIKILEYRDILIENCKIIVQSIKIPTCKGNGWAMSQQLPTGGFRWVDVNPNEIDKLANVLTKVTC